MKNKKGLFIKTTDKWPIEKIAITFGLAMALLLILGRIFR